MLAGSAYAVVGPEVMVKPLDAVTEVTSRGWLPVLRTPMTASVLSVLLLTSPNVTAAGWTSAAIGGGTPVPVSVVVRLVALLSVTVTTQLTGPGTVGLNVAPNW